MNGNDRVTGDDLVSDGWDSVQLELNAYTDGFFDKQGIDPEDVQAFLDAEMYGYRLVRLGKNARNDWSLERRRKIGRVADPPEEEVDTYEAQIVGPHE